MINYQPNMEDVDVLVVGGGVAGLAAAITAAAMGGRTLLIERESVLGGNTALANVHTLCGLFELPHKESFKYANPGFTPWFVEGLRRAGGALDPEVHGRLGVLPIFPPRMAEYALNIIAAFPSLNIMLEAALTGLDMNSSGDTPAVATVTHQGKEQLVRAKIVIDTSGDAVAGTLAGTEVNSHNSDQLQNATLIFRASGANQTDLVGYSRLKISATVARGAHTGDLPLECDSVLVRPGEKADEAYISLNLPKLEGYIYNPLDEEFMRVYTKHAHKLAEALITFLRNEIPGWDECRLLEWPITIGIRETRQMVGLYVMTEEDILTAAKHQDAIARSAWPIELWNGHRGADFKYPDAMADIPLRSLISRSHASLGMAGRCMSGTHDALGALRVSGSAMATGEAIGLAAAIAANKGVSLADVEYSDVVECRATLIDTVFS